VTAASVPVQRPADSRLLVIDAGGRIRHTGRAGLLDLLRAGDIVIANDAATLPASVMGVHRPSGRPVEVRLAGRESLEPEDVHEFRAVVFGEGDFHTRTEDRPAPPVLRAGDRLLLGPLCAEVTEGLGHPRLINLRFTGTPDNIWAGLASHGRPIQYAHVAQPLALWDVWTRFAGPPVAFEPPSAGFALDWKMVRAMASRGVEFGTITHAAGISSTGDAELDRLLPFDEAYRIPYSTARAIERAGRVIAIGTTVVRALEHARGRAGSGVATQRIGPETKLRVVDVIVSGTHEKGSSHYELLRAFAEDEVLERATAELEWYGYRTHEFGDSVWVERSPSRQSVGQEAYTTKVPYEHQLHGGG
jgi:S-adenosylmethionine:tRNA ribosyltransferase-isomerase